MLFTFNKFWKTLVLVVGSWCAYGLWGYEFIAVTLLALLLANHTLNE